MSKQPNGIIDIQIYLGLDRRVDYLGQSLLLLAEDRLPAFAYKRQLSGKQTHKISGWAARTDPQRTFEETFVRSPLCIYALYPLKIIIINLQ